MLNTLSKRVDRNQNYGSRSSSGGTRQPPSSADAFFRHPLFLWMPYHMWSIMQLARLHTISLYRGWRHAGYKRRFDMCCLLTASTCQWITSSAAGATRHRWHGATLSFSSLMSTIRLNLRPSWRIGIVWHPSYVIWLRCNVVENNCISVEILDALCRLVVLCVLRECVC